MSMDVTNSSNVHAAKRVLCNKHLVTNRELRRVKNEKVIIFLLRHCTLPFMVIAEDIEMYVGGNSTATNERHKVLINFFDNSGSMSNHAAS